IHSHGREAEIPDRFTVYLPEGAIPLIDPKSIGCPEIVCNIQIRAAISVYISEGGCQPPISGQPCRLSLFVEEGDSRICFFKTAVTKVHIEFVRLCDLIPVWSLRCLDNFENTLKFRPYLQLTIHQMHRFLFCQFGCLVGVSFPFFFIVYNVEIQKSITIQICKCHRVGSSALTQSSLSLLNKPPVTVIQKEGIAIAQRRDQQVEISIAVDICKNCSGRVHPLKGYTRLFCHIFEAVTTQIPVKGIRTVYPCKINILPSVIVKITNSYTRSVQIMPVLIF